MNMPDDKGRLRKKLGILRSSQIAEKTAAASAAVCAALAELAEIKNARMIAAYMPYGNEVDLTGLFRSLPEKNFCFPRYRTDGLYEMAAVPEQAFLKENAAGFFVSGKYGIVEPDGFCTSVTPEEIDVWLVPGMGFDMEGNRLGRGGGFYDRLLENASGIKIGIGYDMQITDAVPNCGHDQRMDIIVTESVITRIH